MSTVNMPDSDPVELTCPECGFKFDGWPEDGGLLCLDCCARKELAED